MPNAAADFPDIPDFLDRRTPAARQNVRPLDAIAIDIHAAERRSIFDIGDLLIEARAACKHGEWLPWLKEEFEWSATTADNYMWAAGLRAKFPKFGNLKLTKTTIYDLVDEVEDNLPGIIAELAKHATKNHLSRDAAGTVIWRARTRLRWGDFPDATLGALGDLNSWDPWYAEAIAALKAKRPETDDEAGAIVAALRPPEPPAPSNKEVGPAEAEAAATDTDTESAIAAADSRAMPEEQAAAVPEPTRGVMASDLLAAIHNALDPDRPEEEVAWPWPPHARQQVRRMKLLNKIRALLVELHEFVTAAEEEAAS